MTNRLYCPSYVWPRRSPCLPCVILHVHRLSAAFDWRFVYVRVCACWCMCVHTCVWLCVCVYSVCAQAPISEQVAVGVTCHWLTCSALKGQLDPAVWPRISVAMVSIGPRTPRRTTTFFYRHVDMTERRRSLCFINQSKKCSRIHTHTHTYKHTHTHTLCPVLSNKLTLYKCVRYLLYPFNH